MVAGTTWEEAHGDTTPMCFNEFAGIMLVETKGMPPPQVESRCILMRETPPHCLDDEVHQKEPCLAPERPEGHSAQQYLLECALFW